MTFLGLFNMGGPKLLLVLFMVLLLFGGKKLPEFAKGLGQAIREFKKAKDKPRDDETEVAAAAVAPAVTRVESTLGSDAVRSETARSVEPGTKAS